MPKNKRIESEKILEKKLKEKIKKLGGWAIKLFPIHNSGLPDRVCLLPGGKLFFAEIKTTDKNTAPIQRLIHRKLVCLGFRVEVIDTTEQVINILREYE